MAESSFFKVEREHAGERLDRFLQVRMGEFSRSTIQRWIAAGRVTVNGIAEKAAYAVRFGDRIEARPLPPPPSEVVPQAIPLQIVHEDDRLVVIDKPAGMVVHPGAGNRAGTLANALLHHFGKVSRTDGPRPGIVHRLDKETSGILVVAKDEKCHEFLSDQFKRREVEKIYLALVLGSVEETTGKIDLPLGRDPRHRTRISTRAARPREALTEYEVIRRFSGLTYLRVFPKTGRTHQIRAHLQAIGHPVVGDRVYGGTGGPRDLELPGRGAARKLGRHFLHASSLAFIHPDKGRVRFEAELPAELADFLRGLE